MSLLFNLKQGMISGILSNKFSRPFFAEMGLENDIVEILQYEGDHLGGILRTMRARASKSYKWR